MVLRDIALGNVRRRKGKALLVVAALSVAVAAFVLVFSLVLSMRRTMDERLSRYGSNIVVTPRNPQLSLSYGGLTVGGGSVGGDVTPLTEEDVARVRALPAARDAVVIPARLAPVELGAEAGTAGNPPTAAGTGDSVSAIAARAGDTSPGGDASRVLAVGTDLAASAESKAWWRIEGSLPAAPDEVMLGFEVRNRLSKEAGDTVSLNGRTYRVSGVLWETGGEEDTLVFLDRAALDDLLGGASGPDLIEVSAPRAEAVAPLRREIAQALPDADPKVVSQSLEFTNRANAALADFGLAAGFLVAAIAGFVVMATMLTSVKDRQKEIGVLRAVGYKQRHIAVLVVLEALGLSAVSAVVGVLLGLGAALSAPLVARGLSLSFAVDPLAVLAGLLVAFVVGLAAALYPAWRAANLDPTVALRYV